MLSIRSCLIPIGVLFCFLANAEESAQPAKSAGKMLPNIDIWQWLFALVFVLSLFLLLIWLLKKTSGLSLSHKPQLNIEAGISLGMREKLVLVNVGEKQLLLGVTPGRIDKLIELSGSERLLKDQSNTSDVGLFARKLQEYMQSKTHE